MKNDSQPASSGRRLNRYQPAWESGKRLDLSRIFFILLAIFSGLFLGKLLSANPVRAFGIFVALAFLIWFCRKPVAGVFMFFLFAPWERVTILPGVTPAAGIGYLAFFGFVYNVLVTRRIRVRPTGQEWPFLIFLSLILLSSLQAFNTQRLIKWTLTMVQLMLAYYMIVNLIDTEKKIARFFWVILLAILTTSLAGQYQRWIGGEAMRVIGVGRNPNYTAATMGLGIFIGIALFKRVETAFGKLVLVGAEASIIMSFLYTKSRGGLTAVAAGGLYWMIREKKKGKAVVVALLILIIGFMALPAGFKARLEGRGEAGFSSRQRLMAVKAALLMIKAQPLTGVGYRNYEYNYARYVTPIYGHEARGAHNMYLQLAAELGVFGLAVYLLIMYLSWKSLQKVNRTAPKTSWLYFAGRMAACAFIAYSVSGLFAGMVIEKNLWVVYALGVSILRALQNRAEADSAGEMIPSKVDAGSRPPR